jgi:tetratricopeptide (TPR) repeat protein
MASMTTARRSLSAAIALPLMAIGIAALVYARWTTPMAAGDAAIAAGDWPGALAAYAAAGARFDRFPVLKEAAAGDYGHMAANELFALYQLKRYDEVLARAERAPDGAAPHLWAGLALFARARAETASSDAQLGWLARAEDELHRAVQNDPADWDAKYNFELVSRLAAELRRLPKTPPSQLMQLLRLQPRSGLKDPRPVG